MSEFGETRELFPKAVSPQVMVGMASPLWGLFAGAAATGMAWWWMTRWTSPQNLEALFGAATARTEALAEPVAALVEPELPAAPVGGESAPISPVIAAAVEAEAAVAAPMESGIEKVLEAAPKPEPAPEPAVEAAAEPKPAPEPAPAPKPAVKAAPAPKPKAPAELRSVAPKSPPAPQPKAD
jgi:hypothetical protein